MGAIKIGMLRGRAQLQRLGAHASASARRTGVELPGEETGVALPLSEYSGSSMGNLPIGQGELVTPMQMVTRLLGDRQRRDPAPRRTSSVRSNGRAPPSPPDAA